MTLLEDGWSKSYDSYRSIIGELGNTCLPPSGKTEGSDARASGASHHAVYVTEEKAKSLLQGDQN